MRLPLRVEDNLSLRATRHRRNPAKIDAVPRRRCVVRLLASGGGEHVNTALVDRADDRGGAGHRIMRGGGRRSEEHTSELQSLMRIPYAVSGLKKKQLIY